MISEGRRVVDNKGDGEREKVQERRMVKSLNIKEKEPDQDSNKEGPKRSQK